MMKGFFTIGMIFILLVWCIFFREANVDKFIASIKKGTLDESGVVFDPIPFGIFESNFDYLMIYIKPDDYVNKIGKILNDKKNNLSIDQISYVGNAIKKASVEKKCEYGNYLFDYVINQEQIDVGINSIYNIFYFGFYAPMKKAGKDQYSDASFFKINSEKPCVKNLQNKIKERYPNAPI